MKSNLSSDFQGCRISCHTVAWLKALKNQTAKSTAQAAKKSEMPISNGLSVKLRHFSLKVTKPGKKYLDRLTNKHGKGKALSILAHKLGRAVYFILKNKKPFDQDKFLGF